MFGLVSGVNCTLINALGLNIFSENQFQNGISSLA